MLGLGARQVARICGQLGLEMADLPPELPAGGALVALAVDVREGRGGRALGCRVRRLAAGPSGGVDGLREPARIDASLESLRDGPGGDPLKFGRCRGIL